MYRLHRRILEAFEGTAEPILRSDAIPGAESSLYGTGISECLTSYIYFILRKSVWAGGESCKYGECYRNVMRSDIRWCLYRTEEVRYSGGICPVTVVSLMPLCNLFLLRTTLSQTIGRPMVPRNEKISNWCKFTFKVSSTARYHCSLLCNLRTNNTGNFSHFGTTKVLFWLMQ